MVNLIAHRINVACPVQPRRLLRLWALPLLSLGISSSSESCCRPSLLHSYVDILPVRLTLPLIFSVVGRSNLTMCSGWPSKISCYCSTRPFSIFYQIWKSSVYFFKIARPVFQKMLLINEFSDIQENLGHLTTLFVWPYIYSIAIWLS